MKLRLCLATLLLTTTACDRWEEFTAKNGSESGEPYQLTVLSTGSCPLPSSLDPKEVTIRSYRVRLVGQHPAGVPANYFYASLLTTDGSRYLAALEGCQPVLSGSTLRPGEETVAYLNFPLPPAKTVESLVFSPELLDVAAESATMTIALTAKKTDMQQSVGEFGQ